MLLANSPLGLLPGSLDALCLIADLVAGLVDRSHQRGGGAQLSVLPAAVVAPHPYCYCCTGARADARLVSGRSSANDQYSARPARSTAPRGARRSRRSIAPMGVSRVVHLHAGSRVVIPYRRRATSTATRQTSHCSAACKAAVQRVSHWLRSNILRSGNLRAIGALHTTANRSARASRTVVAFQSGSRVPQSATNQLTATYASLLQLTGRRHAKRRVQPLIKLRWDTRFESDAL